MNHYEAREIAVRLIHLLDPYCEKVAIAGSVRRQKPECGDIELVVLPKPSTDMLGLPVITGQELETPINSLIHSGCTVHRGGPKYKQIWLSNDQIYLDLFIVTPPAQFGVIYVIRTGPEDFSHWIVTPRNKGGALPSWAHCKDGAVRKDSGEIVPMPDEKDFLNFVGLGFILPEHRQAHWGKFR